jgi:long-chain acyl-CoA synthetase
MTCTIQNNTQTLPAAWLDKRINRASSGFNLLGVGADDVVAIMLRNEPAYLEAMLGTRPIGAYYCPINWHFKADETGYILRDCAAKVLVVGAELLPQIDGAIPAGITVLVVQPSAASRAAYGFGDARFALPPGAQDWDMWVDAQPAWAGAPQIPRSMLPYTSGTTGRPKGVKRAAPASAEEAAVMAQRGGAVSAQVLGIAPDMRALLAAPLYHSAPNGYGLYVGLQPNSFLVLEAKFDAERTLQLIAEHKLTHAYMVPTMFVRLLRLPDEVKARYDVSSLKFIGSTGSPCAPDVKRGMIDWLGPIISEAYASSETGYVTQISSQEALRKPGSVGKLLPGATVRILDEAGRDVPQGEVGLIYCRQTAYADIEYINQPEARAKIETAGLLCVGDMGYFDAEGYLYISDRKSDMVISGGVNIYPAEIETVLITMPGVADCAVVGIPDEEFGEAMAACVLRREGAEGEALTAESVRSFLKSRIASYKVPREVAFHTELPREESGKIFKRKLRDAYWVGVTRRI